MRLPPPRPDSSKADDPLTPENVSPEAIQRVFAAAFYDAEVDDSGVLVSDGFKIRLTAEGTWIRLLAILRFRESSDADARLRLVNRINDELRVMRACVVADEALFLDVYLPLHGGLPCKTLVLAYRDFHHLLSSVGRIDGEDIVV